MKKTILFFAMMLCATAMLAKDIKTLIVTTTPQMHCDGCEKKIKGNLRFEKGVKKIETSIPQQTVTIEYDADKTTAESIMAAFSKFGYEVEQVTTPQEKCCEGEAGKKGCDGCKDK